MSAQHGHLGLARTLLLLPLATARTSPLSSSNPTATTAASTTPTAATTATPTPATTPIAATTSATSTASTAPPTTTLAATATTLATLALATAVLPTKSGSSPDILRQYKAAENSSGRGGVTGDCSVVQGFSSLVLAEVSAFG
ncbi:unnamed protein product [Closterium sp. NIES-54]